MIKEQMNVLEDRIKEAVDKQALIHVMDCDDLAVIGVALAYGNAAEEDGHAVLRMRVNTTVFDIAVNEIKSLEILPMTKEEFDALDRFMEQVARARALVHVVDCDDIEYTGHACDYTKGDDEENGYPTFYIDWDTDGLGFGLNEIKSIEVLQKTA